MLAVRVRFFCAMMVAWKNEKGSRAVPSFHPVGSITAGQPAGAEAGAVMRIE